MERKYKYKLAISILTKDREDFVRELLRKLVSPLYKRNIGLYLFDGSDDERLEIIIEEYHKLGFENVHYAHYDSQQDIQRVSDSKLKVDAEYLWHCSDKFLPRIEGIDKVMEYLDKEYDIIVYNALYRKGEETTEYFDRIEFFRDCAWKLQMLAIPILHRDIFKNYTVENVKQCVTDEKYMDIEIVLRSIAEINDFKGLLLCLGGENYPALLEMPLEISGHVKEKRTLSVFVEKTYKTIMELPDVYSKEKRAVIKKFSSSTWFSWIGFIKLRRLHGYTFRQCIKYLDKWKLVSNVPIPVILIISLCPCWIMDYVYKIIWFYQRKCRNKPCF